MLRDTKLNRMQLNTNFDVLWNVLLVGQLDQVDDSGRHESVDIANKIEILEDQFDNLQTRIINELSLYVLIPLLEPCAFV